ncbi:hypothetical protein MyNCGM152_08210 [Achromobacter xylosoxidans]|jgi:hypothetical protein
MVGVGAVAADSPLTVTAGSVAASPACWACAGPTAVNASHTGQWRAAPLRGRAALFLNLDRTAVPLSWLLRIILKPF